MASTRRTRPHQPPQTDPVYPPHLGFVLAEEEALKTYLESVIQLPDSTGTMQPVPVWYRYPMAEKADVYPFVTIDWIGIEPAFDLWQSEYRLYINGFEEEDSETGDITGHRLYDPSTAKVVTNQDVTKFFWRRNYLAYRLFYQIGLWSTWAIHDRALTAQMIRDVIGPRPTWLYCDADGVWKRLETLGWNAADLVSQEGASKRIFRKVLTLSIQTEIPQDRLTHLVNNNTLIQKLLVRLVERETGVIVSGEDPTPSDVTVIPPVEGWFVAAEAPS